MSESRRLHVSSPVFQIVAHGRAMLLPGIAAIVVGGSSWQIWVMPVFLIAAGFEVGRYFFFRYRLTDEQIITTVAFIGRQERTLRYERIQNVESVQGVLHRVCRVAEIRIETGAGGKPEAVLRVVPVDEVDRIRARVFAGRSGAGGAGTGVFGPNGVREPAHEVARVEGLWDFVRLGLTTMRGMVLLAVVLGLAWEFKLFQKLGPVRDWATSQLASMSPLHAGLVSGSVVFAFASALILASIVWAAFRFGGFKLTRAGEDFRIETGLLTRVGSTVPRHRIQMVRRTDSFQNRRFERSSIRVETAGGVDAESGKESSFGRQWFVPLATSEGVRRIAREIRPTLSLDAEPWERLSSRAKRRRMKKSVAGGVLTFAALGVWGFFSLEWWLLPAFVCAAAVVARDWWETTLVRYRRSGDWIGVRTGALTRTTCVAFLDRVQVIEVTESPFDRRAGMATLRIDSAGGTLTGPRVDIPMLDRADAEAHAAAVARAAERGGFVW